MSKMPYMHRRRRDRGRRAPRHPDDTRARGGSGVNPAACGGGSWREGGARRGLPGMPKMTVCGDGPGLVVLVLVLVLVLDGTGRAGLAHRDRCTDRPLRGELPRCDRRGRSVCAAPA